MLQPVSACPSPSPHPSQPGHWDRRAQRSPGSRLPASCRQLPRPPVCTSCPAQPARVAEGFGADGISMPFPPLSAGASFPSQHAFFFLVYQALGKAGASQAPSRAPLGGRQLGADGSVAGAGGLAIPSLHLTPAALVWQSGPLPAWGRPPKTLFRDWKP